MADLQRTFLAGRMNKDLDERLIPDGEYRDAVNITIDTSEGSSIGAVQNAFGNTQLNIPQSILASMGVTISNDLSTIGAVTYEAQSLLYWFVVGSNFEGIFEYNQENQITSLILGCTQGQLGFTKNNLITGVNYITDGKGSGILVWNDNKNEPRKINISRARTYSVDDPRIDMDINLIVRPPLNAPYIKLSTLPSPNLIPNNIEDKFVYFSYRYKYVDNEYSSMSPFSAVAFDPKVLQIDSQTGENKGMLNKFNQVELSFETGNKFVKEIQLLVWESRTLNVRIIDNLNKSELSIPDDSVQSFVFMNNKTYAALPSDQTTRLFDNVPLKALAQDVIGSRLVMGNYTQFRDLVNSAGMIDIAYVVDYIPEPIIVDPKQTWRSDRDYEIGIAYLDDYGRMTTVLTTSSDNTNNNQSNSVYIPAENSDTANSLVVTIKNKAPEWATGYRFFVKQSKGEYYNIFPTTYVADGSYRYFLINESDRDKIKVNGYIIFKSSGTGPTNSNKRFKVLELDYKAAGFQGISGALEGLYFKIKASSSDTFLNSSSQQVNSFVGSGRGPKQNNTFGTQTYTPVDNIPGPIVDTSFYSHTGDNTIQATGLQVIPHLTGSKGDWRISVEILSNNQFRWTSHPNLSSWSAPIQITTGIINIIPLSSNVGLDFSIEFQNGTYTPNDRWVFNIRGAGWNLNGTPTATNQNGFGLPVWDGTPFMSSMVDPNTYGGHAILKTESPIFPGAQIDIEIEFDSDPQNPQRATGIQSFTSQNYYSTLEEWFYESGSFSSFIQYNQSNVNIGSKGVVFRYGTSFSNIGTPTSNQIWQSQSPNFGDLYMLIQGFGNGSGSARNEIKANIKISQTPSNQRLTAETVPSNDDTDIYYELSRTHKIENGNHLSLWKYDSSQVIGLNSKLTQNGNKEPHYFEAGQTVYITSVNIPTGTPFTVVSAPDRYSIIINYVVPSNQPGGVSNNDFDQDQTSALNPAIVVLNNTTNKNSDYNAYCYGNGVESNRILDTYNEPWLKYSLRASTVIEDYEQQVKDASLTYSGLYQWSSSINRLNEFNLSTANFKNLDKNFGSVQKIYARTTDLLVLHQNKITSVLYGKNLLVDAVGGGTVASVPEVLGTQIAYPYEFGISSNPESFAVWGDTMYFSDSKRGAVLKMTNDQVLEVSRVGMSDYFRDLMKATPQFAKLGAYDPYNHNYVIASAAIRNTPCDITINPTSGSVAHNTAGSLEYMFSISGTTSWNIQVLDNGFGTSWIEVPPYCQAGVGSQDIYARVQNNLTATPRSIKFRVHYCNSYVDYTLTQGRDQKIGFNIITFGIND
jgi:hypothetical protein